MAIEHLVRGGLFQGSSGTPIAGVACIEVSLWPKTVSHASFFQHGKGMFMSCLVELLHNTILLMCIRCWDLKNNTLFFEPVL